MQNDIQKSLENLLFRIAQEIANTAHDEAPVVTKNLANDIQVFDDRIDQLEVRIGSSKTAPYARYVHEGTGIYGPKKKPIRPKKKKALAFTVNGEKVVVKSVKGQRANPYLKRGAENYLKSGGLDRTLKTSGKELETSIINSLRKAVENVSK